MGRDLHIYYYVNKEVAKISEEESEDDYGDNLTKEEKDKNQKIYKARDERVQFNQYDGLSSLRNVDLGRNDHFQGSCEDLELVIKQLVDESEYYTDYLIIGRLSIILGKCPNNYNYIVIQND
jgi:hypothetical protein